MGEYKPFRMKHQGKNVIKANFSGSFKLSDASKPSTAQDPSGAKFIGKVLDFAKKAGDVIGKFSKKKSNNDNGDDE